MSEFIGSGDPPPARPRRSSAVRHLAAIVFGCAIVIATLALAEGTLRLLSKSPPPAEETWTTPYMALDPVFGWRPLPSISTQTQKRVGGTLLYDVRYSFDEHRRRIVPADPGATYDRFLLFFGDSNTFGEGLNDDETLPYFVSRQLPGTHAYNFGFRGYGPQHMLAWLESSDLRREIPEPVGTAVFVYPAFLWDRLIGGSRTLSWSSSLPYYRFENGEVVRNGLFQTERPLYSWAMRTIGSSRLLQKLNIAWPPRPRAEDVAFVCAVFAKAHALLQQQLGPTALVVAMHPTSGAGDVATCLEPRGIHVLDYHMLFKDTGNADALTIPGDGHPTSRGNRLLADRLVADLRPMLPAAR